MSQCLRIATRESKLALWQAEHVQARLQSLWPDIEVALKPLSTRGDRITDRPLAQVGGKGLFLKELETALIAGEADLAVHSMKDVPAELDADMELAVALAPASPFDAFVSNRYERPGQLPAGAVVGTSSPRRAALIQRLCPEVEVRNLRGNVQTRLGKLDGGEYDAILLACAGLERLGLGARIRHQLSASECMPAIGQGVLGVEIRADDARTREAVAALGDETTRIRIDAERAVTWRLGGSCHLPIAAHASHDGHTLTLVACVVSPDGDEIVMDTLTGSVDNARDMGIRLAEQLLYGGAEAILSRLR